MEKLRWGVLGAGGIADRRTLPGMMKARNAELIAVMEVDAANARRLQEKYGAKRAYVNDVDLLADPEIDAVYIASPVALHARQARMAAEAGKHILLEKPLALTADEAQRTVDECETRGVKFAAGFMMRFGTHVMAMRRAVREGQIGQIVSASAAFTCWYPEIVGSWRQKRETGGGGALMDMGVHCIDLMQYIVGSRVRQVASFNDTLTFQYEVEDSSALLMRMENGTQCVVQANFNIPDSASKWRLDLFGTRGRLLGDGVIGQVDGGSLDALFVEDPGSYDATQMHEAAESQRMRGEFGDLYTREIESFGNSVLEGLPLEVPAQDAVDVQRIVEAAYRSTAEGRFIDL